MLKQRENKERNIPNAQLPPALLHHFTNPSSPPDMNAPADPAEGANGLQDTDQTSPVSWMVDTAARAATSQTFIVLSADLSE